MKKPPAKASGYSKPYAFYFFPTCGSKDIESVQGVDSELFKISAGIPFGKASHVALKQMASSLVF
jgi:hypothetical protein